MADGRDRSKTEKAAAFDALCKEIEAGNLNISVANTRTSSSMHHSGACVCSVPGYTCGGHWESPNPPRIQRFLADPNWIPCNQLIQHMEEFRNGIQARYFTAENQMVGDAYNVGLVDRARQRIATYDICINNMKSRRTMKGL